MGKDLKGKNLGKGITQRKDGRYQARYTDRFGNRQTLYGKTLKEIKNLLHQETLKDIREENVKRANLTVDEWFKIWCRDYKETTIKKTTLLLNERDYKNQIKPVLGNKKVSEVLPIDIVSLINNMSKKYKKSYVKEIHGLLYDIFKTAHINELCKKNPVYGTKYGGKPSTTISALSIQDQLDFLSASKNTFYYDAYIVQLNTGLRIGELTGLCVDDIDLENNLLHIQHNLVMIRKGENNSSSYMELSTPKTKSGVRTIPMNALCRDALIRQLARRKNVVLKDEFKNLVFYTKRHHLPVSQSVYYSSMSRTIKKINKERQIHNQPLMTQFGPHTFRHTFATRCFEAGIQPKTVQAYLGHSSLQMTMDLYTSVMKEKQIEDMCKLDVLMNKMCS